MTAIQGITDAVRADVFSVHMEAIGIHIASVILNDTGGMAGRGGIAPASRCVRGAVAEGATVASCPDFSG